MILLATDGVSLLVEKWRSTTVHLGDTTKATPPQGGTPVSTVTDVQGRPVELKQHTTALGVDGASQSTKYFYNRKGQLTKVSDPDGNEWTYSFDV